MYPIGSIYISYSSTNPSTLFGGIWEQIQGKFLLGVSSTYTVGSTGGNTSVTSSGGSGNTGSGGGGNTGSTTLTINQIPSHNHSLDYMGIYGSTSGPWGGVINVSQVTGKFNTKSTGGGQGHTHTLPNHTHSIGSHTHTVNTLPPYIAVYMWRRTA